ncbi:type III restriction/modification enzyme, methylase subunit [Campylobacter insulaenigrae]|nr:type III restriction/modification enzyme, methylase subunit [Campylobacter insulaenigrae]
MKNRLEVAREFLRDDGVIFIQCDDNEQAYLKVLCDEIFGRENFVSCITHIVKPEGRMYGNVAKTHEYILIYTKKYNNVEFNEIEKKDYKFEFKDDLGEFNLQGLRNRNVKAVNSTSCSNLRFPLYVNPYSKNNDKLLKVYTENKDNKFIEVLPSIINDLESVWRWSKEKCKNEIDNLCARKSNNGEYLIFQKIRKNTTKVKSIFNEAEMITQKGTNEIKALFANDEKTEIFATPKPEALIQRIVEISTNKGDLILDFFAGSGTTLAVAHKMNRRYRYKANGLYKIYYKRRLKKVVEGEQGGISKNVEWSGGGSFIYAELMPLNALYKEKIQNSNNEKELESIYKDLEAKAFLDYRVDLQNILKDKEFKELNLENKKEALKLILDSNIDYVLYGDIEDKDYKIDDETIKLNKVFYGDENV